MGALPTARLTLLAEPDSNRLLIARTPNALETIASHCKPEATEVSMEAARTLNNLAAHGEQHVRRVELTPGVQLRTSGRWW